MSLNRGSAGNAGTGDRINPVLRDYEEVLVTNDTANGDVDIDMDEGNIHKLTLIGNVTLSFSNPPITGRAGSLTLVLIQDATGSRTITWPVEILWASGTAPTLTDTAGTISVVTFITIDAGTTYYGFLAGDDLS